MRREVVEQREEMLVSQLLMNQFGAATQPTNDQQSNVQEPPAGEELMLHNFEPVEPPARFTRDSYLFNLDAYETEPVVTWNLNQNETHTFTPQNFVNAPPNENRTELDMFISNLENHPLLFGQNSKIFPQSVHPMYKKNLMMNYDRILFLFTSDFIILNHPY